MDSIGCAVHHLGRYAEEGAAYADAASKFHHLNVPSSEAHTRGRLGDTFMSVGRLDAARSQWSQALGILERLNYPHADVLRGKLKKLVENGSSPDVNKDAGGAD